MGFWLGHYRKYRLNAGCSGGFHGTPAALPAGAGQVGSPPRLGTAAQQAQRSRGVDQLEAEHEKANSQNAWRTKIFEFIEFSDYCRANLDEAARYQISYENIYDFVFYVCFREVRDQKECNELRKSKGQFLFFFKEDYEDVLKRAAEAHGRGEPTPEPEVGLGYSYFEQTRTALKKLYKEQVSANANSLPWDHIWTENLEKLGKMVQKRKNRQDRRNFVEKIDNVSAPYTMIEKLGKIEQYLWDEGAYTTDKRKTFKAVRNRYVFLRTLQALLRGESLMLEELSDFFGLDLKSATDPHAMEIFISQLATGKTNGLYKLFGRSCRHVDVLRCAYGGLGFWLAYRFFLYSGNGRRQLPRLHQARRLVSD